MNKLKGKWTAEIITDKRLSKKAEKEMFGKVYTWDEWEKAGQPNNCTIYHGGCAYVGSECIKEVLKSVIEEVNKTRNDS